MAEAPEAAAVCDGGDLDCGSGLLLIIRDEMSRIVPGAVLEVRSREPSVREDLPAWCRMVGHDLVTTIPGAPPSVSYFLRKKGDDEALQRHLDEARAHVWRARVRWKGGLSADVFCRNHRFVVGQPASFDTEDAAVSAIEHLVAAIGSALVVGFAWRLGRQGVAVRQIEGAFSARCENILVFLGIATEGSPGLSTLSGKIYVDADGAQSVIEKTWNDSLASCPLLSSLAAGVQRKIEWQRV